MANGSSVGERLKLVGTVVSILVAAVAGLWTIFGVTTDARNGAKAAGEIAAIKVAIGQLTRVVDHNAAKATRVDEEQRRRGEQLGSGAAQFRALRDRLQRIEARFERHEERHQRE